MHSVLGDMSLLIVISDLLLDLMSLWIPVIGSLIIFVTVAARGMCTCHFRMFGSLFRIVGNF